MTDTQTTRGLHPLTLDAVNATALAAVAVAEDVIAEAVANLRRMVNPSDSTDALMVLVERAMWAGFGCTCCGHADPTFVCLHDLTCPLHGSAARPDTGGDRG